MLTKIKNEERQPKVGYVIKGGKVVGKAILLTLVMGGIVIAGAVAPNIFVAVQKLLDFKRLKWNDDPQYREKKVFDSFAYLRRKGFVNVRYVGKQMFISLTPAGKKIAKKRQIDSLHIERENVWDGRWRMVMFDISEKRREIREAFRGKLIELGFFQAQKSVWIHAFSCEKELKTLKTFFGMPDDRCMCFEIRGLPEPLLENAKQYFRV